MDEKEVQYYCSLITNCTDNILETKSKNKRIAKYQELQKYTHLLLAEILREDDSEQ